MTKANMVKMVWTGQTQTQTQTQTHISRCMGRRANNMQMKWKSVFHHRNLLNHSSMKVKPYKMASRAKEEPIVDVKTLVHQSCLESTCYESTESSWHSPPSTSAAHMMSRRLGRKRMLRSNQSAIVTRINFHRIHLCLCNDASQYQERQDVGPYSRVFGRQAKKKGEDIRWFSCTQETEKGI